MLVVGGFLITYDQLRQIGLRRGLDIQNGNASLLNRDFRLKGIKSIYALPVDYPRRTPFTAGVPGILIASRNGMITLSIWRTASRLKRTTMT
jgi:hypothetical protein